MKKNIETLFLLSPVFMVFAVIFNFPDTKFIVSRLTAVVCCYCLFFYREDIIRNLKNSQLKVFILFSFITIFYFSLLTFIRGDQFSLPRSILVITLYLVFVPWKKVSTKSIALIIIVSSLVNGAWAVYEHYYLGHERVGWAVNPIPYAFYSSSLFLCCMHILRKVWSNILLRWLVGLISFGPLYALMLSGARGVWLALPIAMLLLCHKDFSRKKINKSLVLICCLVIGLLATASNDLLEQRINKTQYEIMLIKDGDYTSSAGIRLSLWKGAINLASEKPIFGIGDSALKAYLDDFPIKSARGHAHLHNQYLQLLISGGVVGLFIVITWLASSIFTENYSIIKITWNPLSLSILGLLVIASLTDVHLMHGHVVYLISLILGGVLLFENSKGDNDNTI